MATPSAADDALAFSPEFVGEAPPTPWAALTAFSFDGDEPPAIFAADSREVRRVDAAGPALPFPGGTDGGPVPPGGLVALDWNHDFRMDLAAAGPGGVRLFIQSANGTFSDETAAASRESGPAPIDATGAWAADIEMDGDLDIVVGVRAGPPVVLRNNGDGTWRPVQPFAGVAGLRAFVWGDLDGDGDPDAALVGEGRARCTCSPTSRRDSFNALAGPDSQQSGTIAAVLGDVNADGALDLVTLDASGAIRRASLSSWCVEPWSRWQRGRNCSRGPRPGQRG